MSQCCGTGQPPKDLSLSSLCSGQVTSCNISARNITSQTISAQSGTFEELNVPESTLVYANQSATAVPTTISLLTTEISEIFDAEASTLSTWPNLFQSGGFVGFQPALGGLFYSAGTTTTGTYFQWNNVNVQKSGFYSLRNVLQNQNGNGQYTLFVDGLTTGLTLDFSLPAAFYTVHQWSTFYLSQGLHTLRIQCTGLGSNGSKCDFSASEQPFLLVLVN